MSLEVLKEFMMPFNYARRDLVAAILLYFSLISSSLKSKSPLPPFLPSARAARLRLIYEMRKMIVHTHGTGQANTEYRNLFWFAYSSALEEVIEELEGLSLLVKLVVGEDSTMIRGLLEKIDFNVMAGGERTVGFNVGHVERCGGVMLESTVLATEGIRRRLSAMESGEDGMEDVRRLNSDCV